MTAAIYFAPDGYRAGGPKLMGRHAAGAGFLRAFAATENSAVVTGFVPRPALENAFREQMQATGYAGKIRTVSAPDHALLADPGAVYLPGPGLGDFAWRRLAVNERAYSLCGVTHTTASHSAMTSIAQLATAPVAEWDALICTSRAVLDSVQVLLGQQADYLRWRLGATRLALPQLPVIPLGVHCSDFVFSSDRRQDARARLGVAENDLVLIFLGRLSFHAKAHPQAMYLALEQVASRFPDRRIHLVQCGWFANDSIEKAFRDAARILCNSVEHHFLDGRDAFARDTAWAAADIYVSLSDNIQETFGLSPLEAMAAGLPVVVSDWDGYRDTVRDGIDGFRVPTLTPAAPAGEDLGLRYDAGIESYDMYCGLTCELVAVDVAATVECISRLVADPGLRERMGRAGRARACEDFDWRLILGRYRELWSELSQRRLASSGHPETKPCGRPDRTDPFALFAAYPSRQLEGGDRLELVAASRAAADAALAERRALALNAFARYVYPDAAECRSVIELVAATPGLAVDTLLSAFPAARRIFIYRGLAWLMKMDILRFPQ